MQKILSDQSTAKYSMLEKTNRAAWVKVDNLVGLGKYRTRTGKTREKIVVSFLPQGALNQYVHLQQRERLILSIIIWIQDPGKRKLCKDGGLSSNRAQGLEQLKMESVLRAPDRTSSGTHLLWWFFPEMHYKVKCMNKELSQTETFYCLLIKKICNTFKDTKGWNRESITKLECLNTNREDLARHILSLLWKCAMQWWCGPKYTNPAELLANFPLSEKLQLIHFTEPWGQASLARGVWGWWGWAG